MNSRWECSMCGRVIESPDDLYSVYDHTSARIQKAMTGRDVVDVRAFHRGRNHGTRPRDCGPVNAVLVTEHHEAIEYLVGERIPVTKTKR